MSQDRFSSVLPLGCLPELLSAPGLLSCPVGVVLAPEEMTLAGDGQGYLVEDQPSVVLAVPVGRDVLIAACAMAGTERVPEEIAGLSDEEIREWALLCAADHLMTAWLLPGDPQRFGREVARYPLGWLEVVACRVDEAFGFPTAPAPVAAVPVVVAA